MDLIPASFVRRYNRFLVDVRMEDGSEETVHCANPGSMQGLLHVGGAVFLSRKKGGKLQYGLEYVTIQDGTVIGVNTTRPNGVVKASIDSEKVPCLKGYSVKKTEVKVGNSRFDFLLERAGGEEFYLEVKNVTLSRRRGIAEFPDSPTARGAKHLDLLRELRERGVGTGLMYVVQRADCQVLQLAKDIDPNYYAAANLAKSAGVEFFSYWIRPSSDYLSGRIDYCQ